MPFENRQRTSFVDNFVEPSITYPTREGPEQVTLEGDTNYSDACRVKRNTVEYDHVGGVTEKDADELIEFVNSLKRMLKRGLKKQFEY